MSKTKTSSPGDGAGFLGGIGNAFFKHPYTTRGKHGAASGRTAKESRDRYNAKSGKKRR